MLLASSGAEIAFCVALSVERPIKAASCTLVGSLLMPAGLGRPVPLIAGPLASEAPAMLTASFEAIVLLSSTLTSVSAIAMPPPE